MLTNLLPVILDIDERSHFIAVVKDIVGAGNIRAFYLPARNEGTTSQDAGVVGRTWTHGTAVAGRLSNQNEGWLLSFNGTSDYISTPDASDLSFGNGVTDQAFSGFAVANITDTVNARAFISKSNTGQLEWQWGLSTTDIATLQLTETAGTFTVNRAANAAAAMGALNSYGFSYSGLGGATAMTGVVLYQNGASVASTNTDNAGYTAMSDKTAVCEIGSVTAHTASFGQGSDALVLVVAGLLSADQMAQLHTASKGYLAY